MAQPLNHSSNPSPTALRWVADAVGAGATIRAVSPLAGATSSLLHSIEVIYQGRIVKTVLRQFVDAEWLAVEPDLARHEAASLRVAASANVPTPALIAYDEKGDECGAPSTLVTLLPGAVDLQPADFDRWLRGMAAALRCVHKIETVDFPWEYFPYNDIAQLQVPGWSACPEHWAKAIEIVQGPRPRARERFIHRDYHPNNVLWQGSSVSGVIDWVNACRGAPGIDVGWCRQNLAQLYGVATADRFLEAYRAESEADFEYHPFWDLITLIEHLPGPPGIYPGWPAFGINHLDEELVTARIDDYLTSLIVNF
ncbi:MAG TPA: aminoglycoside phosphotransferase family protein [Pyrinomonadaceae bacterium]|jgi:aminoglycoside phosphotransferase (APT) family kinase protein|nr:aminoglycoside phosphotransferase family protein [Pyrinomonadaceae bacterium]